MHKVILETKNEISFRRIIDLLKEKELIYYEWVEQPENISTCLATLPYKRSDIGDVFKKCQLFK